MRIPCKSGTGDLFAFHFTFFEMDHYSNLWIFVSKFTSASAGKLYKIYRKAKKNMSSGALHSDSEHQVKWLSNKCDSELILITIEDYRC